MVRTLNCVICLMLLSTQLALSDEHQKEPDQILYQSALEQKRPSIWTLTIRSRDELKNTVAHYTAILVHEYQKLPESLPVDKEHWAQAMFREYRNPSYKILCASEELVKRRIALVEFAGEKAVREIETQLEVKKFRKLPSQEPTLDRYRDGDRPPFESLKDPKAPWKDVGYSELPHKKQQD